MWNNCGSALGMGIASVAAEMVMLLTGWSKERRGPKLMHLREEDQRRTGTTH
jgi:hypothetical protein